MRIQLDPEHWLLAWHHHSQRTNNQEERLAQLFSQSLSMYY
jgi:hypothetical protein